MEKDLEKLAEIRNQKGEILWSVWLNSDQAREFRERINEGEDLGAQGKEGKEEGQGSGFSDEPMTYAQKRYLFRLLAERGIEGEAAYQNLKETFGVDSLKKITKYEASQAIDQMLNG